MRAALLFLTAVCCAWPPRASATDKGADKGAAHLYQPKVVVIAIDGVRRLELEGKAVGDDGAPVPAESLFPFLFELRARGVFLPEMRITNPAGISLPAYADIFAGRRQERIVNNAPADARSQHPTVFQAARAHLGTPDSVAVISSWKPLCPLSSTQTRASFFRHCGWEKGKGYAKPEVFEGSRTDADTLLVAEREIRARHPRLVFIHLGDADEEAHLHQTLRDAKKGHYGIFPYHQALRNSDYIVSRLYRSLQSDPFYKDTTTWIVTTDHGRDDVPDPAQWWDHGECIKHGKGGLCEGCRAVFAIAVGPGLVPATVTRPHTHADLAPTVAKLLGFAFPTAKGTAIPEVAP